MTDAPLVSVIVPSYNYGHFLGETLASVSGQTWTAWECIVVDDGSTDDTWEIALAAARVDARIRYLRRNNGGLATARNTGLGAARGAYVQLLDADDAIEPRKLERQVAHLEAHASVDIVYGNVRYFDSETRVRRRALFSDEDWMPMASGSGERVLRALLRANIMVVNAPLVRRGVFDRVGRFDERLTSLEDWDYWLRCAAAGMTFDYLDEAGTLALVRAHGRSMSQNRATMYEQQARVRRAIDRVLDHELRALNRFWRAQELAYFGHALVAQGDALGGARRLVAAACTDPRSSARPRLKEALRALLPF